MEQADAGLRIAGLREESCLRPEIEGQHLETRWLGAASSQVADAAAAQESPEYLTQFEELLPH